MVLHLRVLSQDFHILSWHGEKLGQRRLDIDCSTAGLPRFEDEVCLLFDLLVLMLCVLPCRSRQLRINGASSIKLETVSPSPERV